MPQKWEYTYKPGELNELRDSRADEHKRRVKRADPEVKSDHLAPQNLNIEAVQEVQRSLRQRR